MRPMLTVSSLLLMVVAFSPSLVGATSVRSVSVGEMIDRSQLIFEGRVVSVESREEADLQSIRTCVLFEVMDLVKGEIGGNTLELCFAGGTIGDRTRWVSGMVYPEPGESGIYFIEDAERPLVNPVFGWDQGRFPIEVVPGEPEARVTVGSGQPVVGLGPGEPGARTRLSSSVAAGVEVAPAASTTSAEQSRASGQDRGADAKPQTRPALSPRSFKSIVRSLMEKDGP